MTASAKEVIAAAVPSALETASPLAFVGEHRAGRETTVDGSFDTSVVATAILAALDAAGYAVTKVHERRAGMQIVHHGGLAYVVHPDIPLHVWDGKTMTRVTDEAQEKQG